MSNGLVRDANTHVKTEPEAEEVVHEHQGLEQKRLLRARLQVLGLDPYQPATDNGEVQRAGENDGRGTVDGGQALGGRGAGQLRVEPIAQQRIHALRHLHVHVVVQPLYNLHSHQMGHQMGHQMSTE